MVPDKTSCAPSHKTKTTEPKIRNIATAVSKARARVVLRAAMKACSTAPPNRVAVACCALKACMVLTAPMLSEAKALASASLSCAARERART